jgi:hypothetical protein
VPGIDDRETHLYREYDSKGRMNESFYRRATLAGIKNLETNSYRKDSPIMKSQERFPEKYSSRIGARIEPGQESFALNIMNKLDSNFAKMGL